MRHLILLMIPAFLAIGNAAKAQKIEWSKSLKLTEADFQKKVPYKGLSQTVYPLFFIEYEQTSEIGPFPKKGEIKVSAYFMPTSSWIEEGANTIYLLKYADMSFNLYEYGARLMRKELYEQGIDDTSEADLVHEKIFQSVQNIQNEYGKETSFGRDVLAQKKWEVRIDSLMSEVSNYCKGCQTDNNTPKGFK